MGELTAERIHIIGIGGAGMSALAKVLHGRGVAVSGSDVRWSAALASLADLGMEVWSGHRTDALTGVDLVVASSAVPDRDPEWSEAVSAGIETWRRPQLLHALTASLPTIGVTGTHGKTSSTAMLVSAVHALGIAPTFVVGGELVGYRTNAAVGSDPMFILEVDEAFGTFEHVVLEGLVVTNVEAEHLDHFGSVEELENAFARVVRRVNGPVVVCTDDPGAARLATRVPGITFGFADGTDWTIGRVSERDGSSSFSLKGRGSVVDVELPRLGRHMVRNAAGVLALLAELGHDPAVAASGIADFGGVKRRFEHRGTVRDVTVIDDYAHHPTEVAATIIEASQRGGGRVVAVFQPHLYSRTQHFADAFGLALARADVVIVTDIYGSREDPIPGVTGRLVADAAVRAGAEHVEFIQHLSDVPDIVAANVEPGDLVLTMGAGDITVIGPEILAVIEATR
jgi:UDP-N-acetylmuramate--alanine ligase